jgi:hypothetical protein
MRFSFKKESFPICCLAPSEVKLPVFVAVVLVPNVVGRRRADSGAGANAKLPPTTSAKKEEARANLFILRVLSSDFALLQ